MLKKERTQTGQDEQLRYFNIYLELKCIISKIKKEQ